MKLVILSNEQSSFECCDRKISHIRRFDFRHDVMPVSTIRFPLRNQIATRDESGCNLRPIYFDPNCASPVKVVRNEICPRRRGTPFLILVGIEVIEIEEAYSTEEANVGVVLSSPGRAETFRIRNLRFRDDGTTLKNGLIPSWVRRVPQASAKYKSVMSAVYSWGQCEGLIPRGEHFNPCRYVKGREFSKVTDYEALALEIEDMFKVLSELKQPEYELALLVATCGLRISEALGLRWRDVLWDRGLIAIRQTFVHFNMQPGAKTKLSRSRVEAPQLLLDALAAWRWETMYANDDDFVFPSVKLHGRQPRSASQLVEDYIRPAAIAAGVIRVENGVTYDRDGEVVKRFGFHNLGRHSLATFLMDEQENPAVVQAIMRHAKMDMTLYYSHSRRKAKRAAQEKVLQHLLPEEMREPMREPVIIH